MKKIFGEPKPKREVKFWACDEDEEHLTHTDAEDAVAELLEETPVCEWPEEITVKGFAPMQPDLMAVARDQVQSLVEWLDEELGDPDGGYTEPTSAMQDAGREFVRKVFEEYEVWACEVVETKTIKTVDWLKQQDLERWLNVEDHALVLHKYPELREKVGQ